MTTYTKPQDSARPFKTAAEVKKAERPEQTEAEIREWVKEQIRADKKTLDLLATL